MFAYIFHQSLSLSLLRSLPIIPASLAQFLLFPPSSLCPYIPSVKLALNVIYQSIHFQLPRHLLALRFSTIPILKFIYPLYDFLFFFPFRPLSYSASLSPLFSFIHLAFSFSILLSVPLRLPSICPSSFLPFTLTIPFLSLPSSL